MLKVTAKLIGDIPHPKTRGECERGPRPCPYVGCKYHLYLDVTAKGGLKLNYPGQEPWELSETCALDVADRGEMTLEEVGNLLQVTRERIRQIWEGIKEKLSGHERLEEIAEEYDLPKAA